MRLRLQILYIVSLMLAPCLLFAVNTFWDTKTNSVDDFIKTMSDEEIIGQIFMLGWQQTTPSQQIKAWIKERNIGGIKIFGWNGKNILSLAKAIKQMQELAQSTKRKTPLLVATDQEGGWVRHIKDRTSITPGNIALGASHIPYDAFQSAFYIGLELKAIGVNMNFAPVVDVYSNPQAHVIGPRAFSSDPKVTAMLGSAFFHGLEKAGIIATAKHYPGHGNTNKDSHGTLPRIYDTLDTLKKRDLLPFRVLSKEGIPALQVGHLQFPLIDKAVSSASSFFLTQLLRHEMQYQGIIITDDLYMAGAQDYRKEQKWSFAEMVLATLNAGSDMILLSRTPDFNGILWNSLLRAFKHDAKVRIRISNAAKRILLLKKEYFFKSQNSPVLLPNIQNLYSLVPNKEGKLFFFEQAARSISVVRNKNIPYFPAPHTRILLVGNDTDFIMIGKEHYPQAQVYRFHNESFFHVTPKDKKNLKHIISRYDTVIFCLMNPGSAELLQELKSILPPTLIVISALTPVYLLDMKWVQSAIAIYGWGKESFEAGFAVLNGDYTAEGSLPIYFKTPTKETIQDVRKNE